MIKLEYIWLDGNKPQQLRSKVKITNQNMGDINLSNLSGWSFDGSSTKQAEGKDSDCYLKPVYFCRNPLEAKSVLVLCEVMNEDGTPHPTNTRAALVESAKKFSAEEPWFGIEQEFFLYKDGRPLGWPAEYNAYPPPQGTYYCGVGADRVFGRDVSVEHATACMNAGLSICGTNAEVAPGQWEYQVGPLDPISMGDQLWMSRYLLNMVAEKYGVTVYLNPKPLSGDWNGSGGHTNYSTKKMREEGGLAEIHAACKKLEAAHALHMEGYGEGNRARMTGLHETSGYDTFKAGNSDRGCSIRIPLGTRLEGKGYFEDRRPAANLDPYIVCRLLLQTTLG